MDKNNKLNILFLIPGPVYRPHLPNFSSRYEVLSGKFKGSVFINVNSPGWVDNAIGDFKICGFLSKKGGVVNKIRFFVFFIRQGFKLKKQGQSPDVIVAFDPVFTGIAGMILKWMLHCRLVIEINNNNYKKILEYGIRNIFVRYFKMVIYSCVSFFTLRCADGISILPEKNHWTCQKKYLRQKIFPNHFCTPVEYFWDSEIAFQKIVLFVGMPFYLKGVDILIEAFKKISQKNEEFKLRLIGYLLDEHKNQYGDLDGRIEFMKPLPYDELKQEYLQCYCFVLPSRAEGMGMVLLEAMASGKPVIGSNVGGIPGVIEDGRNGFLFESENSDDLADKLDKLLSDPGLARHMGEEGRKVVMEKFSSEEYLRKFRDMIDKVVNKQ